MIGSTILDVAQRVGATLRRVGTEFIGPCPRCGGRDRFSVNPSRGLFNCRGCAVGGDDVDLVRHMLGLTYAEALAFVGDGRAVGLRLPQEDHQRHPAQASADNNRDRAVALWRRRKPVVGTLAEDYLRRVRGYTGAIRATLGYLPASGDFPPAMIAAFAVASEPEPGVLAIADADVRAVHLTRLTPTAERIDKSMIGRGAAGTPIVIAPPNDLLGLAITEGIEDALSVHLATGLGAWVAGSAPFMPALADAVPSYIECVSIIADADETGQRHAHQLAARLAERRIETSIKTLRRASEAA